MPRPKKGEEKGQNTPATMFRLDGATLGMLDAVADHYTAELGTPFNRTSAFRLMLKREHDRIRRIQGVRGRGRK